MLQFRAATKTDLPKVIRLLADDPLGKGRERFEVPLPAAYVEAFQAMLGQDGNRLIVAIEDQNIVGCLQPGEEPGMQGGVRRPLCRPPPKFRRVGQGFRRELGVEHPAPGHQNSSSASGLTPPPRPAHNPHYHAV